MEISRRLRSFSTAAGTVRTAPWADVPHQEFTLPWLPLTAITAPCVGLTLVAALVGSRRVGATETQ